MATQKKSRNKLETITAQRFVLQAIDLYNWGAFAGRHHAELDARGSAIIGPTGSGKTTVVDALMTLLCERPKYNLASTGGHESDRDLMSYIRGVSGAGNDADNRHIARPDKTTTAISATFVSQDGNSRLEIAGILWLENASNASSDRKDVWLVAHNSDECLNDWLEMHHEQGVRALKKHIKSSDGNNVKISDTKKAFLGQVRRFFEVGDNAFNLLNRAAGLKQLNSIDAIFRELVLEDNAAFTRAANVVKEFADLTDIRSELDTARAQLATLQPIAEHHAAHKKLSADIATQERLIDLLPTWFAQTAVRLWRHYADACVVRVDDNKQQVKVATSQLETAQAHADQLRAQYLQVGGNNIEQLEQFIKLQTETLQKIRKTAKDYQQIAQALTLDSDLSAPTLQANQQWAQTHISEQSAQIDADTTALYELGATRQPLKQAIAELADEIDLMKSRPHSNISHKFHAFRQTLAEHLQVGEDDLPFVAELVSVKPEEQTWRGAIERAIGSHRLRILVAPELMKTALRFVNDRDNRLHVRLLSADEPRDTPQFMTDGFTRKLQFKSQHSHIGALKQLLANIDRHCVASAEDLASTPHAMTAQGLMSNQSGYFDKQDQKKLSADWLTGFDNRDRLAQLNAELGDAERDFARADRDYQQAQKQLNALKAQLNLLEKLRDFDFDSIDVKSAEQALQQSQQQLADYRNPNSDTAKAKAAFDAQQQVVNELTQHVALKLAEKDYHNAEQHYQSAEAKARKGLSPEQQQLADKHLKAIDDSARERLDALENEQHKSLSAKLTSLANKRHNLETKLVRAMEKAQQADTGALIEVGTELRDIDDYLFRLKVLSEEDLPAKQKRFLDYLNTASDQGVTQLLTTVDNEINVIETRIAALNETLKIVDFQPNRYLQLKPQRVSHQSLRDLSNAQRRLRSEALSDETGEKHYAALKRVVTLLQQAVEQKRTQGAKALLDARYRLQFSIEIIARDNDEVIETRTGSQGGSGGEKEIIASYILTASLSYALSPRVGEPPRFSTIVLDEAFSKSSQAVAGRIIEALRQFGLHPLFVTPNKEMRLLRDHTRSAILVYRKADRATMTTMTWEALEETAERFRGR